MISGLFGLGQRIGMWLGWGAPSVFLREMGIARMTGKGAEYEHCTRD
jgi:hypothetical protein